MEKKFLAKCYAELFKRGERFLKTHNYLINMADDSGAAWYSSDLLTEYDCLATAMLFFTSSLEAFINRIGYIFIDDWDKYEKRNSYDQYRKIIDFLTSNKIQINGFIDEPYLGFWKHRKNFRNPMLHPLSSNYDSLLTESEHDPDFTIDGKDPFLIWNNVQLDDVTIAHEGVKNFIEVLHKVIESSHLSIYGVNNLKAREELLNHFLRSPFIDISGFYQLRDLG